MSHIQRVWRGRTTPEHADAYERLLVEEVLPGIAEEDLPGSLGAVAGRRDTPDGAEFITILGFRSLDAGRGLTGEDDERSYVPPAARALLADYEEHAAHYRTILERRSGDAPGEAPGALAEALRAVVGGPMWHGPTLAEALEGVDARTAASRPIPGAPSIWELVLRVGQWAESVGERVEGRSPEVGEERNFPPVTDTGEDAWSEAVAAMKRRYRALADLVASADPGALERPGPDGKASPTVQVRGVVEHGIYHAGQIVLLRRAAGAG